MEIVKGNEKDHTVMGPDSCPHCNYKSDVAGVVEGEHNPPMPGDISICLNCGEANVFADDMALKKMPAGMRNDLSAETLRQLHNARRIIKERGPIKK